MSATGKIVEVLFEKAIETFEHQDLMLSLSTFEEPDPARLQTADNIIWRPAQQHAPILDGWDLSGQEQDIIEETYPAVLGTPTNDFVRQRADDLRDMRFWERRGTQSGLQQATNLNKVIAEAAVIQGAMFVRSNAGDGYSFIAEAQALMNERQLATTERLFILNDRDNLTFGQDLAGRQTLQGRPEETWKSGQIGKNIAGFDVYTGSFIPNITSGGAVGSTVDADVSFKPEGGSVNAATGVVTNIDYRIATIPVASSSMFSVGDKVVFGDGTNDITAVGLADKTDTGVAMTFTIVGVPNATSVEIFPKPIALDDPALNATERAYSNIANQILTGYTISVANVDTVNKANIFFDRSAIEVLGGVIPAELFKQYDGMKVISHTMANGLRMYMVYDGSLVDMTFRYRLFVWAGVTVANPQAVGVAVTI
jgi:hypothetical protein